MKGFLTASNDEDRNRNRRALFWFLIGMVFVIWAWLNLLVRVTYRASELPTDPVALGAKPDGGSPPAMPEERRNAGRLFAKAATPLLAVGFLLILVFLIGTFVLIRGSRRFLAGARRERAPPSEASDVWAMHKAPSLDDDGDADPR